MILIGMGSNLTTEEFSTSKKILEAAMDALNEHGVNVLKCSKFYQTEPVPKSDQPWFVNAVIAVKTSLDPLELLKKLHEIEKELGRVRRERWEARIIDLDLLCYDDFVTPDIKKWQEAAKMTMPNQPVIPHARLHERDFVLIPLKDVSATWVHPIFGENVEKMLEGHDSVGIVRLL